MKPICVYIKFGRTSCGRSADIVLDDNREDDAGQNDEWREWRFSRQ